MVWNVDRLAVRLLAPKSWRVRNRRFFALTFPVSAPLWLAAILIVCLIQAAKLIAAPFVSFWNDEPTHISSGYYDYSSRRSRSGDVVRLKSERPDHKRAA